MMALVCLIMTACSTEDTLVNNSDVNQKSIEETSTFARGTGDFKVMLTDLYGAKYKLGTVTKIVDKGIPYTVTAVNVSGLTIPQGYIVESPTEDIYYEHIAVNSKVNEYSSTSSVPTASYDVSQDPIYLQYGFTPNVPATAVERVFGYGEWYQVGPCSGGWKTIKRNHRIFGIRNYIQSNIVPC